MKSRTSLSLIILLFSVIILFSFVNTHKKGSAPHRPGHKERKESFVYVKINSENKAETTTIDNTFNYLNENNRPHRKFHSNLSIVKKGIVCFAFISVCLVLAFAIIALSRCLKRNRKHIIRKLKGLKRSRKIEHKADCQCRCSENNEIASDFLNVSVNINDFDENTLNAHLINTKK